MTAACGVLVVLPWWPVVLAYVAAVLCGALLTPRWEDWDV